MTQRIAAVAAEVRRVVPDGSARLMSVSPENGIRLNPMALSWPPKDPDEVLDYEVDWTWRLYSESELAAAQAQQDAGQNVTIVPADTIATSTFTLPSGATLVADSTSNTTTASKVWLSGGTDGESYPITNEITTSGGRTMDQTIKLRVKTK